MALSHEIHRVRVRLRLAIKKSGLRQSDVSARLGFNPNYLSQILSGGTVLSLRHILGVLEVVGSPPIAFFAELYGFADLLPDELPKPRPIDAELARLCESLWVKIAEAGKSQREVSEELGEHYDYVNQVIRGMVELKLEHILAILAVLDLPPALFFEEHFGLTGRLAHFHADDRPLVPGMTWGEFKKQFFANLAAYDSVERRRKARERRAQKARERRAAAKAARPAEGTAQGPETGPEGPDRAPPQNGTDS